MIRLGTISGSTFTEIHSETATQDFMWNSGEYMTWALDAPPLLMPNTTYAVDVGLTYSEVGWRTGIPYITMSGNEYAEGRRYTTGSNGIGGTELNYDSGRDRIFHIDFDFNKKIHREDRAHAKLAGLNMWTEVRVWCIQFPVYIIAIFHVYEGRSNEFCPRVFSRSAPRVLPTSVLE